MVELEHQFEENHAKQVRSGLESYLWTCNCPIEF